MKSSQRPTEFEQNNYDITSIPGHGIKKNNSRGAKHGPPGRQRMYYQTKTDAQKGTTEKARKQPNNNYTMVRERNVQDFVASDRWKEKSIMLYDRIALGNHIYVATRAERIQNSKNRILTPNAERTPQPLNQRPDFAQAKRECGRLHDERLGKDTTRLHTEPSLATNEYEKEKNNNSKTSKNSTTRLTLQHAGKSTKSRVETCQQLRHRRQRRRAIGFLSILQGLTICEKKFSQSSDQFRLPGENFPGNRREG